MPSAAVVTPEETLAALPQPKVNSSKSLLTDLDGVATALGVSRRYIQMLVSRKAIPVIRLGRRCVRFDLTAVLAAVRRFEIEEINRRS